jgi:arginine-tRNA-protein transferase
MNSFRPPHIEESFKSESMTHVQLDACLQEGWVRFGIDFKRHSFYHADHSVWTVQPLRVPLSEFRLSKSQRRILRRNADLQVRIGPAKLDETRRQLFNNHKRRFTDPNPDSLEGFIGTSPARCPCETVEIAVYEKEYHLIAASYLDIGRQSASSIHASYDLACGRRRLGICTMLWEIDYARERGCAYYYPGFAFHEPSCMDYKKQFPAMEWYDWQEHWLPLHPAVDKTVAEPSSQLELIPA